MNVRSLMKCEIDSTKRPAVSTGSYVVYGCYSYQTKWSGPIPSTVTGQWSGGDHTRLRLRTAVGLSPWADQWLHWQTELHKYLHSAMWSLIETSITAVICMWHPPPKWPILCRVGR